MKILFRSANFLFILIISLNAIYSQTTEESYLDQIDCRLVNQYKTKVIYESGFGFFSPSDRYFIFEAEGRKNFIDTESLNVIKPEASLSIRHLQFIDDHNIITDQAVTWGGDYRIKIKYDLESNKFLSEQRIEEHKYPSDAYRVTNEFVRSNDLSVIAAVHDFIPDTDGFNLKYKYYVLISGEINTSIKDFGSVGEKINCIDISPNKKYIVAGGEQNKIKIWDLQNKSLSKTIYTDSEVTSVCFHPSNELIVCGDRNGKVYLINTYDWEIVKSFYLGVSEAISDIEFDPNGNFIVCISDNQLLLIDIFSHQNITKILDETSKKLVFLSFSHDGRHLMVGERNRQLNQYRINYDTSNVWTKILHNKSDYFNKELSNNNEDRAKYFVIDTNPLNNDQSNSKNNLGLQFEEGPKLKFAENSTASPTLLKISRPVIYPNIVNTFNYYPVSPIFEINSQNDYFTKPFLIGLKLTDNNNFDQDSIFVGRISNGKLELLHTVYDEETDYYFAESNKFSFWGLFKKEKPRFKFVTTTPNEFSGIELRGIRDYNQCDNCYTDDLRVENFKEDLLVKCGVIDAESKVNKARLKLSVFGEVGWAYDMTQKVVLTYDNVGYNRIITPSIMNKNQTHQSFFIDTYSTEGKTEDGRALDFYDFTITKKTLANILCTVGWINKIELQVLLLNDDDKIITNSKTTTVRFHPKSIYNNRPQISLIYPDYSHGDSQQFFLWNISNKQGNSIDIEYQLGEVKLYVDTDDNPFDGGWLAFEGDKTSIQLKDYFNDDPIRVYYRNQEQKLMILQRYYWGVSITKRGSKKKEDIVYSGVNSFQVRHTTQVYTPQKDQEWIFQKYLPMPFLVKWDYMEYLGTLKIDIVKNNDPYYNPVFSLTKYVADGSVNITEEVRSVSSRFPKQGSYKVCITFTDLPSLTQGISEQFTIKNPYANQTTNETYAQETKQEEKMTDGEFLMQLAGNVIEYQIDKKIQDGINHLNAKDQESSSTIKSQEKEPNLIGTYVGNIGVRKVTLTISYQANKGISGKIKDNANNKTYPISGYYVAMRELSTKGKEINRLSSLVYNPNSKYFISLTTTSFYSVNQYITGDFYGTLHNDLVTFSGMRLIQDPKTDVLEESVKFSLRKVN